MKGDLENTGPLHFSLKSGLRPNWREAFAIADVEARIDRVPVAGTTHREGNHLEHFVHMRREDFFHLLAEYSERGRLNGNL